MTIEVEQALPAKAREWYDENVQDVEKDGDIYFVYSHDDYPKCKCELLTDGVAEKVFVTCEGYRGGKRMPVYEPLGDGIELYADNLSDWAQSAGSIMQYYLVNYKKLNKVQDKLIAVIHAASGSAIQLDKQPEGYQVSQLQTIMTKVDQLLHDAEIIKQMVRLASAPV